MATSKDSNPFGEENMISIACVHPITANITPKKLCLYTCIV